MDIYMNINGKLGPKTVQYLNIINGAAYDHALLRNEGPSALRFYISHLKSLINTSKQEDGLYFLLNLLPSCSEAIFTENAPDWMKFLTSVMTNASVNSLEFKAASLAVTYIWKNCHLLGGNGPKVPVMSPAVLLKLSSPTVDSPLPYKCLYQYLCMFPGHALNFRKELSENILSMLSHSIADAEGEELVTWAGKVFAVIPQPNTKLGLDLLVQGEARGQELYNLLAFAHNIMDKIFDMVQEKEKYDLRRQWTFSVEHVMVYPDSDPVHHQLIHVKLLANVFIFIEKMLQCTANVTVKFVPKDLVGVVTRILQVEVRQVMSKLGQEYGLIAFFLPFLQKRALLLLTSLLDSCGESLDMLWCYIQDQLACLIKSTYDTLKVETSRKLRTDGSPEYMDRGEPVRSLGWKALAKLIKVSHGCHALPHSIVPCIVIDLGINVKKIMLQRKSKKGFSVEDVQKTDSSKGYKVVQNYLDNVDDCPARQLCRPAFLAALEVIEAIFHYAHTSITLKDTQLLQSVIFPLVRVPTVGGSHLPFCLQTTAARTCVYRILVALAQHPHPFCPPPYVFIMNALQSGLEDESQEVKTVCQDGIVTLSFIMANPRLNFYAEGVDLLNQKGNKPAANSATDGFISGMLVKDLSERFNDMFGCYNVDVAQEPKEAQKRVDANEVQEEDIEELAQEEGQLSHKESRSSSEIHQIRAEESVSAEVVCLEESTNSVSSVDEEEEESDEAGSVQEESFHDEADVEEVTVLDDSLMAKPLVVKGAKRKSEVEDLPTKRTPSGGNTRAEGAPSGDITLDDMLASFVDTGPDER